MRRPGGDLELRFLFDEPVNVRATIELQSRGVDLVLVRDVGLAGADDDRVFDWARRNDRLLVTRNYQDFAPLAGEANRRGMSFPGVLFLAPSIPQSDPGAHVRSLEEWISRAIEAGINPAESTWNWLT